MNRIQRLKSKNDVFVTIVNADFKGKVPAEDSVIRVIPVSARSRCYCGWWCNFNTQ